MSDDTPAEFEVGSVGVIPVAPEYSLYEATCPGYPVFRDWLPVRTHSDVLRLFAQRAVGFYARRTYDETNVVSVTVRSLDSPGISFSYEVRAPKLSTANMQSELQRLPKALRKWALGHVVCSGRVDEPVSYRDYTEKHVGLMSTFVDSFYAAMAENQRNLKDQYPADRANGPAPRQENGRTRLPYMGNVDTGSRVLVLLTCDKCWRTRSGFRYPESGKVRNKGWEVNPRPSGDPVGLLWGEGDSSLLDWTEGARWVVCSVDTGRVVDRGSYIHFSEGEVVHVGDQLSATTYIREHGGVRFNVHGVHISGGDGDEISGGNYANLSGGRGCRLYGGAMSNIKGGDDSQLLGGDWAVITGGDACDIEGGNSAHITGGSFSKLSGGRAATIYSGDFCAIFGGDYAVIRGGCSSIITAGHRSIVSGGNLSDFYVSCWSDQDQARRVIHGRVGQGGLKPDTPYRVASLEWVEHIYR